ncbi:hypothetical protein IFM89_022539, partial [Coptis chinensis]
WWFCRFGMDFGLVGFDSLVGGTETSNNSFPEKGYGSVFHNKQESLSSTTSAPEDDWKMDYSTASRTMLLQQQQQQRGSPLLRSTSIFSDGQQQQQMLSFSSPKSDSFTLTNDYYHHALSAYTRNAGFGSGSLNANYHGVLAGARGPFTPSQWMELEHQALIYKYINANVPIPSNLLIPIRRALNPSAFSGFSGPFRPNTLGWGSFHLGFSGNNDPEPGRCRRTDGKKWRCSRDSVADQKYCERHMNRGRHRSRKPVEGHTGHAATGPATTKVIPLASSPVSVAFGGATSNSLNVAQDQVKHLQTGATALSPKSKTNRILLNSEGIGGRLHADSQSLSMLSAAINVKSRDTPFSIVKQHAPSEESSRTEFGLISSDSLQTKSQKSPYVDYKNFESSPDLNSQEHRTQDPLRHFIDDWPKNRSNGSVIAWPDVEETQLDRTQLSISIPMSSDFSSSSSSPTHEKLAQSPLRLSREFDPIQMGLGLGSLPNEHTQRQVNWIPISWESSMGGPLGEVLKRTNNTSLERNNSSSDLNLMTEGWDAGLQMELSPTGVLQKTSFGSLSNSSTGSSPRAETNMIHEGGSLCDSLLGPTFVNSSSIPSL